MTVVDNIYSATPRKAREYALDAMQAGLTPMLKSSPGLGKSSIMAQIANDFNLELIDHRLSTSAPEDLSGLPQFVNGKARFAPFEELFPITNTPIPDGKDGFLLFLDEFNSASKEVQAASYKLILDRKVGQYKLHLRTMVAGAGNLMTDRAIVNNLSTAMQSRLVHINMIPSLEEWMEDVAAPQKYDERVRAYLLWKGVGSLMDFRPDHNEETFCCPRTWEFMHRLLIGKQFHIDASGNYTMNEKIGLYAGTITSGEAVSFVQFCKIMHNIVKISDVLRDPTGLDIPHRTEARFGVMSHLATHVDDQTFAAVSQYMDRFDIQFRVLFYRTVKNMHPALVQQPPFRNALVELSSYLTEGFDYDNISGRP